MKKIKTFASEKARLLKVTQKIKSFWDNEKKPSLREMLTALDLFVDIVKKMEQFAISKEEKDLIKQIRCFFVPEEELFVLLLLLFKEPIHDLEDKKLLQIVKKFLSPGQIKQREEELKIDVKKIEAILLQ